MPHLAYTDVSPAAANLEPRLAPTAGYSDTPAAADPPARYSFNPATVTREELGAVIAQLTRDLIVRGWLVP